MREWQVEGIHDWTFTPDAAAADTWAERLVTGILVVGVCGVDVGELATAAAEGVAGDWVLTACAWITYNWT